MLQRKFDICLLCALFTGVSLLPQLPAAELQATSVERQGSLPEPNTSYPFDFTIDNGLYATICAMSFDKPQIKNERTIKMKIDGFKKPIEVHAVIQDKPAPMVVTLLGITSKSKGQLARLWEAELEEAGFHVMAFDSVFRADFNERCCQGVCGNLAVEACVAARIINAFLDHPDLKGKVTKVYLLGASYGGILALNFDKLAKEGKIGLVPERVLVYSPPVSMMVTVAQVDKYYDEDKPKHGLLSLLKLKDAKPVAAGKPVPFSDSLMRAGIGYVFHEDLKDAISTTKDVYGYSLPDAKDGEDKNKSQFMRYIEKVVFPYWQGQRRVNSIDELWDCGNLYKLIQACPDNIHVVVAADDPLNDPTLLKYVQRDTPSTRLTVLPRGGHLGFVGCNWAKQKMLDFFK